MNDNIIYKKISFLGYISEKKGSKLKELHDNKAYYNTNTVKNSLVNNKLDKIDRLNRSGIYQASCQDCASIYIGQTGRNFITRFSEHLKPLKIKKLKI